MIDELTAKIEQLKAELMDCKLENAELRHKIEILEHDIQASTGGGTYIDLTKVSATG